MPKQFNLQFFAEGEGETTAPETISTVNALDALMESGNTTTETADTKTDETDTTEGNQAASETTDAQDETGGGDNLNDSTDENTDGTEDKDQETKAPEPAAADTKANAAFAKMRADNKKLNKTMQQIAEALGLDTSGDVSENLLELASQKLAEKNKLPVEVYKELSNTREQLGQLQQKQNIDTARGKLNDIRSKYKLTDQDVGKFLDTIEAEGINPIEDPTIDVEYHYYRHNKDAILEAAKETARQDAIKNSAAENSTKPDKLSSKNKQTNTDKINSVGGLNALLDKK